MKYAGCNCRGRCDCAAWEARLKADGLAHLDYEDGGDLVVGNKGSGKINSEGRAAGREESEAYKDAARAFLREYRFPRARDRRIWAAHCEGTWTVYIAKQLHHDRKTVQASIARSKAAMQRRANRNVTIEKATRTADHRTLVVLFRCLAAA